MSLAFDATAMAILQALLALISKSAGKVLNAIFGWAVHALFGRTSAREQTLLSGLVAAAVAWPLLLLGLIAPKVAALVLAFVPIPHAVPSWIIRLVWLVLALVVPFALGIAVSTRAPAGSAPEPTLKRLARGFPITVGLAAAFIIMFLSVPVMRVVALIRKQKSADMPLLTHGNSYHQVAASMIEDLNDHGFALRAVSPGWWISAPIRILGWFGGSAFRGFVPERPEHYQGPGLSIAFYTSAALLRGSGARVTWAHGLMAESAAHCDAFQTVDSKAQRLETEIRRLWNVYQQEAGAHRESAVLLKRLDDITRELGKLDVEFDEWQVIYRQLLQLDRAVRGRPQLLELVKEKTPMSAHNSANTSANPVYENSDGEKTSVDVLDDGRRAASATGARTTYPRLATPSRLSTFLPSAGETATTAPDPRHPTSLSTAQLMKEISVELGQLLQKQVELAKADVRADLRREAAMAKGLGLGAFGALLSANLLLVSLVLALSAVMPGWAAGLIVTGLTLAGATAAALTGWNKRVRTPMARLRRTLADDARWVRERLA